MQVRKILGMDSLREEVKSAQSNKRPTGPRPGTAASEHTDAEYAELESNFKKLKEDAQVCGEPCGPRSSFTPS